MAAIAKTTMRRFRSFHARGELEQALAADARRILELCFYFSARVSSIVCTEMSGRSYVAHYVLTVNFTPSTHVSELHVIAWTCADAFKALARDYRDSAREEANGWERMASVNRFDLMALCLHV